jgi:hypothetical protein
LTPRSHNDRLRNLELARIDRLNTLDGELIGPGLALLSFGNFIGSATLAAVNIEVQAFNHLSLLFECSEICYQIAAFMRIGDSGKRHEIAWD